MKEKLLNIKTNLDKMSIKEVCEHINFVARSIFSGIFLIILLICSFKIVAFILPPYQTEKDKFTIQYEYLEKSMNKEEFDSLIKEVRSLPHYKDTTYLIDRVYKRKMDNLAEKYK
ncbi:hypothetical protein [Fusobacterium sp. PH5-44]|uniref:hypothetical protein n=1 Tax=unclassified Fusobacterium TaxID=2648384 RepID=UPI003D1E56D4